MSSLPLYKQLNFCRLFIFLLLSTTFLPGHDLFAGVQVIVRGNVATTLIVTPNPSRPTAMREIPGIFNTAPQPNARNWVRQDEAGVICTFKVDSTFQHLSESSVRIYDSYGTVMALKDNAIQIPTTWSTQSIYDYDIYWNGTSSSGDFVHPGVYTAELKYRPQGSDNPKTLTRSFYMEKPAFPVKGNTCGTGYAVAFVPALGFRIKRHFSRFFRSKGKRSH